MIPDTAEALVDVRSLPADQPGILAEIQRIVGDDIEIETVHSDVGLEVPFAGEAVDAMIESLRLHDPEAKVLPYLLSGGTDNKALSRLGITGSVSYTHLDVYKRQQFRLLRRSLKAGFAPAKPLILQGSE